MRLKKVALNNFRCFKHLELDLHPRLTVLVGDNASGKTAILDGIAAGLSPILRYLSTADQRLSGPGILDTDFRLESVRNPRGGYRHVTSEYSQAIIETFDGLTWDNWRPYAAGKQPQTKVGQSELAAYAGALLDKLRTPKPDILPVIAYYGVHRGLIEIPERLRGSKVDYSQPTAALIGTLNSGSDFRELVNWFDIEESAEYRANKGRSPEDTEPSIALSAIREIVSKILGRGYIYPHFNEKHKFVITYHSQTGPMELQVSQLSQGYQSMLALGMDFARRLALANGHLTHGDMLPVLLANKEYCHPDFNFSFVEPSVVVPAIMLVDEIDLHLHPSWQQRVLHDLMKSFPLTQFIITTHSPQVVSTVPDECIRVLEDGQIHASPPGTEGAEASRVLKRVLGVDVRPQDNEATKELKEYLALVDDDNWESPRALELRKKLDDRYQGEEPELSEADLRIENRKWELGK